MVVGPTTNRNDGIFDPFEIFNRQQKDVLTYSYNEKEKNYSYTPKVL